MLAIRSAPPDSAIIFPSIVPNAKTIAKNPNVLPSPSLIESIIPGSFGEVPINGIPIASPTPIAVKINATNGCHFTTVISKSSMTTAASTIPTTISPNPPIVYVGKQLYNQILLSSDYKVVHTYKTFLNI